MIAQRPKKIAPDGMVRVDVPGFLAFTDSLFAEARSEGRSWLTWQQWQDWGRAAMRSKLVRLEDLKGDLDLPRILGAPFKGDGLAYDGIFWRNAVLKTWRRVREAKDLGLTPEQFHRDEKAALERETERQKQRDKEQLAERIGAGRATSNRHRGAAGDL